MSSPSSFRHASTTLLSATLVSLCQLGQVAAAANSAPVLAPNFSFFAISENDFSTNNGDILFTLLNSNIYQEPDLQTNPFLGIAITRVDDTNGTWQYAPSTVGVPVWIDIPTDVSDSHALLLSFNAGFYSALRFVPKVNFKTVGAPLAGITLRAWDGTDGLSSSTDALLAFSDTTGATGGTNAYSSVASVGSISVTPGSDFVPPFNTAPVLNPIGTSALGGFPSVDASSPDVSIAVLLGTSSNAGSAPITDPDTSDGQGIAIVDADSANGTWEYSADGVTFAPFPGNLSSATALVLAAGSELYSNTTGMAVRFTRNIGYRGTATFSYRAWDQSDNASGNHRNGTIQDTTSNGGTSAYSAAIRTATISVLNSAPSLTVSNGLGDIPQDEPTSSITGETLASLVNAQFSDPDFDVEGVAVVGADNSHGTWQYTTDGSLGGSAAWVDIGTVSASHALLLHFASSSYSITQAAVRFLPNPGFHTSANPVVLTVRAWDETDGLSPSTNATPSFADVATDVGVNGGASAYASSAATFFQQVIGPNNAPVLAPGTGSLGTISSVGIGTVPSFLVSDLLSAADNAGTAPLTDVDDDVLGIVVTAADTSNGSWELFSGEGGFSAFPSVAVDSALVLLPGTEVRFVPTAGFTGSAALTYRGWDGTDGSGLGELVDPGVGGGTTAFSSVSRDASITVQGSANVAPVLVAGSGNLGTVTNAVDGEVVAVTVADIISAADNGGTAPLSDSDDNALGIAVTAADGAHGTWEYLDDTNGFTPFPALSASTALVLAGTTQVRFVPAGDFAGSATLTYRGWDGTDLATIASQVDPGAGGGSSAYSAASRSAAFTITRSPFTEITDTSGSGLQAVVATLLAPNSQITVDTESITFVGTTTVGGSQASTMSAIDLGTAADGTHMTIAGSGLLLTSGDGTPRLANTDAADIGSGQSASVLLHAPETVNDGDADLTALTGDDTHDACILSFNFTVPAGIHSVTFQMMFGSEEFSEYLNDVTDGAAVFVDGHDAAHNVAVFDGDAAKFLHISSAISSLIESNITTSPVAIEYNGITRPATVTGVLDTQLTVHTIKIVVADTADFQFDSGLFVSALSGSTATTGGGIVVVPPGPPGSANVAHVTVPPIGISSGNSVIYASVCSSTDEGVANLTSHLAGRPNNQVRSFTWDATTQAYVELPEVPTGGLQDDTGVFIATRQNLGLDFSGTPKPFPFDIVLHPGFNFVGVPPLGTLSSFETAHVFPDDFTITTGQGTVSDPAGIADLLGTPGGDVTTAEPFFWNGSAYVQDPVLTTGKGYWIKNNGSTDVTLTRVAPLTSLPGNTGAFVSAAARSTTQAAVSATSVHDRGVPPPPPGGRTAGTGSATAASGSGGAKSCGLGSGVAAFASMLMMALRRRLRGGRRD